MRELQTALKLHKFAYQEAFPAVAAVVVAVVAVQEALASMEELVEHLD